METKQRAANDQRQTKLEFMLSWVAAIAIAVIGDQLGAALGFFVFVPVGVATGFAAAAVLSKPWSLKRKAAALLLIYAIVGLVFWLMFGIVFPVIRTALGFAS